MTPGEFMDTTDLERVSGTGANPGAFRGEVVSVAVAGAVAAAVVLARYLNSGSERQAYFGALIEDLTIRRSRG